jgi:hypothetical protein
MGKPEGKISLRRLGHKLEYNIKIDLQLMAFGHGPE